MRTITASDRILTTDSDIICNSASTIYLQLYKSVGDNKSINIKNIGAGLVYVLAVGGDYIDASDKYIMSQWDGLVIDDDIAGIWLIKPYKVYTESAASAGKYFNVDGIYFLLFNF
jgi:hypothetical protein